MYKVCFFIFLLIALSYESFHDRHTHLSQMALLSLYAKLGSNTVWPSVIHTNGQEGNAEVKTVKTAILELNHFLPQHIL